MTPMAMRPQRKLPTRFSNSQDPNRHCERSEAIQLVANEKTGLLRRFAPRNDVKHESTISPRDAPELCTNIALENRGRRESRVPAAPAASRAK
jgi:hypothetical protein